MSSYRVGVLEEVKLAKGGPSKDVNFLYRDEIDCLLAKILKDFNYFSHEEFSSIFHLLKVLFRNANRPFTPFYSDGYCLNNQVRKGWIFQVKLLPPLFISNSVSTSFYEMIEDQTKEICSEKYQAFEEVKNDISNAKDKKLWLKNMERTAVAYNKVPEHMKIDFIMNSETDRSQAIEFFQKMEVYIKKFNKS